jgi:hypothetical protein
MGFGEEEIEAKENPAMTAHLTGAPPWTHSKTSPSVGVGHMLKNFWHEKGGGDRRPFTV